MRTKVQSLDILTRYAKARLKNEKFIFCISGVVNYDGKEWGIYSLADCNTMPEHRGRLFLRLHRTEGYTTRECEAWLDELDEQSLDRIVNRTHELFKDRIEPYIITAE